METLRVNNKLGKWLRYLSLVALILLPAEKQIFAKSLPEISINTGADFVNKKLLIKAILPKDKVGGILNRTGCSNQVLRTKFNNIDGTVETYDTPILELIPGKEIYQEIQYSELRRYSGTTSIEGIGGILNSDDQESCPVGSLTRASEWIVDFDRTALPLVVR